MPDFRLTHEALAFLRHIPAKHAKQIMGKVMLLAQDPHSVPSRQLIGHPSLRRAKSGEYRIIYRHEDAVLTLLVLRVGKRNDAEVYRNLKMLLSKNKE
jgi:mRNA interferase RelE/StbE